MNNTIPTPPSHVVDIYKDMFTPRDYQISAVQHLRESLAGNSRVMLYSPTGSGKTEIAMMIVKGAIAKGKRVAFLCNRVHLVDQTSRRFSKSRISHGILQGENTTRMYENVLVVSIQTAARRGLPEFDLIVIDEAHAVAGSKDYRSVIFSSKCPVIGLSATPFSKGLGKHYDEINGKLFQSMVIAATLPELISQGFLVDCDIYAPSEPDMTGIKMSRNAFGEMDYTDEDVARVTDNPKLVGDIVDHWLRLSKGLPTVCFAVNIAHSKHIVERFKASGINAEHIDCYMDKIEVKSILGRLESGETTVISNVGILCEGWDFPACVTLILTRATRSLIRYLQMAGRILRTHYTKTRGLIIDHSGTAVRLGFPTDDFPLELDSGNPKESGESKKKEKPLPKACPSCSYVKSTHKCPVCGFAPEKKDGVEVFDGNLVKIEKDKKKVSKIEFREIGRQDFYSQLISVAKIKGYKEGWVNHKYKEKFGVWPRSLSEVSKEPSPEVLNWLKYQQIKYSQRKGYQNAIS